MHEDECYQWGGLFAADWDTLVSGMSERARVMGLMQEERGRVLVWSKNDTEECRWIFVPDPSDVESVRAVYASDENVQSPSCFVVVTQDDPSDTRGSILFDVFQLSRRSYLWHFHRVYTPPATVRD